MKLNKNVINYERNEQNDGGREDIKYLKYERLIYFFSTSKGDGS